MPEQVFKMTMDISQIKSALAELAALQQQLFAQQPPPPTVPPSLPVADLSSTDAYTKEALANLAKLQAQADEMLAKAKAAGAITNKEIEQLKASPELAPIYGPNVPQVPYGVQLGKDNLAPKTQGQVAALSALGLSDDDIKELAAIKSEARTQAKRQLDFSGTAEASESLTGSIEAEVLTQREIEKAQIKRAKILREQIAVLESELGREITQGGPAGTSLADLSKTKQGLSVEYNAQSAAQRLEAQSAILMTEEEIALRGRIAAEEYITNRKIRIAELEAGMSEENLKVKARSIVVEREYQQALNQAIAQELRSRGASKFQVAEALSGRYSGGGGGGATDAGGFFTGGLLSTLRYAVPGALLFGGLAGLSTTLKEAQELQKIFVQLDAQAQALGQTSRLGELKSEILDIAASSGTASTEVANLAFQFQGAFGGDTSKTITQTRDAVEAVKVTGLSLSETIDAFTAITQSYKDTDIGIADVTDTALGLQERFGVLAKETISFASDLAPVGAQIGFTTKELETLGAVAQKYSGRSGSQLAESFGRILPALQQNAVQIVQLFDNIGQADVSQKLADAFGSGQTGEAFKILLSNYKNLTEAQKNFVITQLGGRREAQALIPVLQNADEFFTSLSKSQEDAGKTAKYFAEIQSTLSQQLDILGEKLKQIGIKLFESGVGQALTSLVVAGKLILDVFGAVLGVLGSVNDMLGGIPLTVITLAAALKGVSIVYEVFSVQIGKLIGARTAENAVTAENIGLSNADAVAKTRVAAATEAEAAASGTSTAARSAGRFGGLRGAFASAKDAFASNYVSVVGAPTIRSDGFGLVGIQSVETNAAASAGALTKFRAGVSGAAGAVGSFARSIPGPLIWAGLVLSISELISTINDIRTQAATKQNDLKQQILDEKDPVKRQAMLDRLGRQQLSASERVAYAVSGYDTPQDLKADIERKLSSPGALAQGEAIKKILNSQAGFDIGLLGVRGQELVNSKSNLDSILNQVKTDPENEANRKRLEDYINEVKNRKVTFNGKEINLSEVITNQNGQTVGQYLDAVYSSANELADKEKADVNSADNKKKNATEKLNNVGQSLSEIKTKIDSGEISVGEGLAQINDVISTYERFLKNDPNALQQIPEAEKALADFRKAQNDFISSQIVAEGDALVKLNDFKKGGSSDPSFRIKELLSELKSGKLNPSDTSKVTDDLLSAYKDLYDYKLSNADSIQEQIDLIKNGIPVDDSVKVQVVTQELKTADAKLQEYISNQEDTGVRNVLSESFGAIAEVMVQEKKNVRDATIAVLEQRLALDKQREASLQAILGDRQRLEAAGGEDAVKGQIKQAQDDAAAAQKVLDDVKNNNVDLGDVPVPDAYNTGTPKERAKEVASRMNDMIDSQAELLKAMNEGDSVVQAQIDVGVAQYKLAVAQITGTEEEKRSAQAEVLSAQNSLREALKKRELARYDYLKALASDDPVAVAQIEVQAAQAALAMATPDEYYSAAAQVVQAQKQLRDAVNAVQQAYFAYLQQVFSDDPLKAAEIGVQAAQAGLAAAQPGTAAYYQALSQLDQAQKAQVKAQEDIEKAQLDYAAALVSGDPVKAAQSAKAKAEYELNHARNEVERYQALIANIQADRALADALSAVYASQADLLKASAEYVGDSVKVAQIGVAEAQRILAETQDKYARGEAGEADLNAAKAGVIRANAAARDARIKKLEDDYSFQFEMGQITKSQYIAYLEGLKSLADGNVEIIRDLDRQIHQLKQSLGADLQFNLPTNIGLPTLYEARRLNQSVGPNGAAAGYQDNRNVQVNIQVNSGMDVEAVKQVLGDALGNGRYGNGLRRY